MTDIRYSSAEHAAFNMADKLADGASFTNEEIVKVILAVTHSSYEARKHLDRAMWGLERKNES